MVKKGKYKSRHTILGTVTLFTCEGKKWKKMRPEPGTPKLKP